MAALCREANKVMLSRPHGCARNEHCRRRGRGHVRDHVAAHGQRVKTCLRPPCYGNRCGSSMVDPGITMSAARLSCCCSPLLNDSHGQCGSAGLIKSPTSFYELFKKVACGFLLPLVVFMIKSPASSRYLLFIAYYFVLTATE